MSENNKKDLIRQTIKESIKSGIERSHDNLTDEERYDSILKKNNKRDLIRQAIKKAIKIETERYREMNDSTLKKRIKQKYDSVFKNRIENPFNNSYYLVALFLVVLMTTIITM